MKNVHKKIGAVVLAGMVLVGGGLAISSSVANANPINKLKLEELDGYYDLMFINRPNIQRKHKIKVVGSGIIAEEYKSEIIRKSDNADDFFRWVHEIRKDKSKISFNKRYGARIGDLVFEFEFLE